MTSTSSRVSTPRDGLLTPLGTAPRAHTRLVCFPHSGGGHSAFAGWSRALAPEIELWCVTLPGRHRLADEPFALDWDPLVEELSLLVTEKVEPPFAFFGHSLGALVAFEVADLAVRRGVPPSELIVSGRVAPDGPVPGAVPESDAELLELVDTRYGGLPTPLRTDPELVGYYLALIRADLELASRYRYRSRAPLPSPVTALGGDSDPTVPPALLEEWRHHTGGRFRSRVFPGGHFYLSDHRGAVMDTIRSCVARDVTA